MVHEIRLFGAAAVIITLGALVVALPAPADAVTCNQYGFNGVFTARGDNGWTVDINSTGTAAAGSHAAVRFDDGGTVNGNVSRGGIQGNVVDFAVQWTDKPNNV